MKVAVTMPLWVQDAPALIDQTVKAASCLSSRHELRLFTACTRLHQIEPEKLQDKLRATAPCLVTVLHEPFVERSVAGAWNWGCQHGLSWGADYLLVTANDVEVEPECIDTMVAFGEANPDVAIWSGLEKSEDPPKNGATPHCCDFACFMVRPSTFTTAGWFDARFRPAYFEDNDYYARVILSGGLTRQVPTARFLHHGSLTTKNEPEAKHHCIHWFEENRKRYREKWGVLRVMDTPADVLGHCWKHPWNDPTLPVTFWER